MIPQMKTEGLKKTGMYRSTASDDRAPSRKAENIITNHFKRVAIKPPGKEEKAKMRYKATEGVEKAIREDLQDPDANLKRIALKHGVSQSVVRRIRDELIHTKKQPVKRKKSFQTPNNHEKYYISHY